MALGLVLLFINRLSGLVGPYGPKLLLDRVIAQKDLHFLALLFGGMVLAAIIQGVTSFALGQLMSRETQRVIAEMRQKVQAHVGRLPVSYYDSNKTGALVARIMTDVEGVRSLVGAGFVEFVGGALTASFVLIILVRMSVVLTLAATVFLLIFAFCWKQTLKVLRPLIREKGAINAEVTGRLTESLGGVRVVKAYHAEARERQAFGAGVKKLLDNALRSVVANATLGATSAVTLGSLSAVILFLGARMILNGQMTPGDLFSYMLFMAYVSSPIIQLTALGPNIIEALASLDRTREILAERPEDEDPERTLALSNLEGRIRFDHVNFEYEAGKPILTDLNFEARPGSVTALVGSSGSGKSTIIGLIASFYKPTNGVIFIDSANLSQVRLDSYRTALGAVLQESFLFAGTIRENVMFSRPSASDEEVLRACRMAHVDEFAERFKDKYETVVGERGVKLSGGQRQRVSIARAILADPKILILDEATSSLDSESEIFIQQGLKYLMEGRTTFVIAHRLSTVRQADEILVVESGQIVERGNHSTLYAQQGRYFELYTKQHGIESDLLHDDEETAPTAFKAQSLSR
ncbi:MAG TPA: ABC transporter ATP-binding protein [Candidatus Angelobacter sp.]|nr:ABC transporter ATP-binding protein [Candidatus Angelobacter sp.]